MYLIYSTRESKNVELLLEATCQAKILLAMASRLALVYNTAIIGYICYFVITVACSMICTFHNYSTRVVPVSGVWSLSLLPEDLLLGEGRGASCRAPNENFCENGKN